MSAVAVLGAISLRRSRSKSFMSPAFRPRRSTNDLGCPFFDGSSASFTCVLFFFCVSDEDAW